MQITLCKIIGLSGLAILFPACVNEDSSMQLSMPEQVGFLEIYEEPEAVPLNTLIEKLREKVRDKMPKRLRPGLSISETPPPYVACGQTVTIPGTHLCIFTTANGMNFALNRASQWVEAKELVDHRSLQLLNLRQNVQGHNLSGKDLRDFAAAYSTVKGGFDQEVPPLAQPERFDELGNSLGLERIFWSEYLQKKVGSVPNLYLLAVTLGSTEAINHEVLHALYYSNPKMQQLVTEFWLKDLTIAERRDIISDLSGIGAYDVAADDPEAPSYLLLQEFQAYVLMQRSEFAVERFDSMAKQYQSRLKLKLTSNGIQLPDTQGGQG